ncbi:hemerythrin domain-containing protein [Spirillospora sp. NPDC048911]|uniref:hemerythrin domain-containing protein n=1 Tax=Spirillospora sp. NPDC048911 TaxID=3364527 RepID=UPI003712C24A
MREDRVLTVRPRRPTDPQVDLRLYTIAHRAIQRGAHELADLAGRLRAEETVLTERRAKALETFVELFVSDVRLHHRYEDEIGFPVVRASALGAVDIEPLSVDHDRLGPILAALCTATAGLRADPSDALARKAMAVEALRLRDLLDEHITEEERDIFPAISRYVSVEDFDRWERAVTRAYPKRSLWFTASWWAAVTPPDDAVAWSKTPVTFRLAFRLFKGRYERLNGTLFG